LSHSISLFFVCWVFSRYSLLKYLPRLALNPWSSWSLPPKRLGLPVWVNSARCRHYYCLCFTDEVIDRQKCPVTYSRLSSRARIKVRADNRTMENIPRSDGRFCTNQVARVQVLSEHSQNIRQRSKDRQKPWWWQ
jgi:hypothetical protein